MTTIVKTALIVMMRKLPITISVIVNGELTSPIGIDEVAVELDTIITKKIVAFSVDLPELLRLHYPTDIGLLTAIPCHCDRGFYMMQEGELRVFTKSAATMGLKHVVDKCRALGGSQELVEMILDLLIDEPTQYDWLEILE